MTENIFEIEEKEKSIDIDELEKSILVKDVDSIPDEYKDHLQTFLCALVTKKEEIYQDNNFVLIPIISPLLESKKNLYGTSSSQLYSPNYKLEESDEQTIEEITSTNGFSINITPFPHKKDLLNPYFLYHQGPCLMGGSCRAELLNSLADPANMDLFKTVFSSINNISLEESSEYFDSFIADVYPRLDKNVHDLDIFYPGSNTGAETKTQRLNYISNFGITLDESKISSYTPLTLKTDDFPIQYIPVSGLKKSKPSSSSIIFQINLFSFTVQQFAYVPGLGFVTKPQAIFDLLSGTLSLTGIPYSSPTLFGSTAKYEDYGFKKNFSISSMHLLLGRSYLLQEIDNFFRTLYLAPAILEEVAKDVKDTEKGWSFIE